MSENTPPRFETWGILEIMGHSRFAGFITNDAPAGINLLRIDVPAIPACDYGEALPAFTKWFSPAAIFSMTPCTEDLARHAAAAMRVRPPHVFALPAPPTWQAAEAATDALGDVDEAEEGDWP